VNESQKPALILQLRPEDETSDSEYACILKYAGLQPAQTHRIRIEQSGIPELSLDDYSAIIVGGSPFDISTPLEDKPDIQLQIEADFEHLLQDVVARDFPFLGACSGNGLLGSFLGSAISTRYGEPVSCVQVAITGEGRRDKLLEGFPQRFPVLLGHKEACDETPKGATLLVRGEACPVQMFRVGENVYATQFHPEADVDEFALRIDIYRHHGYFAPREAEQLVRNLRGCDASWGNEILRRFAAAYMAPA
jgi:GMP synthase (glutamine-hydrolysing)